MFVSHNLHIIKDLADYVVMVTGGYIYIRFTNEQIKTDREIAELLEKGIN
jgi:ABC-type Na+ transport system ATPase subunit NatA